MDKLWNSIKNYVFVAVAIVAFVSISLLLQNSSMGEASADVQSWLESTENNDYTVTVVAQTWCSHCNTIKPYIEEIEQEYNIDINWFDVDVMEEVDKKAITETYPINYSGTPHTFIVSKGELVTEVSGALSKDEFVKFFKENGVISE